MTDNQPNQEATMNTTLVTSDPDAGVPEHLRFVSPEERYADAFDRPELDGPGEYPMLTIVTDGCGHFIALDPEGNQVERIPASEDDDQALEDVLAMVRRAWTTVHSVG